MAILNYTTSISAEKTASEIQQKLASVGAQAVLSEYSQEKTICAISFRVNNLFFRLPFNIEGVYESLVKDCKVGKRFKTKEQASRVALRIIKDWIEAQIAIIQAQQADLVQVFLPYAQNQTGKTLYEVFKDNGFKQITSS